MFLVSRLCTLALLYLLLTATAGAAESLNPLNAEPPYATLLRLLRQSNGVLPPQLDIAPVYTLYNREAIIPPQCYTRTEGRFNPCYVCHQNALAERENVMNDGGLQAAYSFSAVGVKNHWLNLHEDRQKAIAAISDESIRAWIAGDNYSELAPRLRDAGFKGWIPDLAGLSDGAAAFDDAGFARDGSGWVAFNYKPFPSTFWPTNGSTDDVMIRLPVAFRQAADGTPSKAVYQANLAILEGLIKQLASVTTVALDERFLNTDLDADGTLSVAHEIRDFSHFVGAATAHYLQPGLYPQGTEFLHTVRYLGFNPDDTIRPSRRMKEVRYMVKDSMLIPIAVQTAYEEEGFEKDAGYLPGYIKRGPRGLDNAMGWTLQGFIEDRSGRLRAATHEETFFCMGCHSSIGSTIDKTFSFARKVDGRQGWGYITLQGMHDVPNRGETIGEIETYLERVGGGDEFRSNSEMQKRWFAADGSLQRDLVRAADVYTLITPSASRALALNKAYLTIVKDQDFIFGRDATVVPPVNVYRDIENGATPTLPQRYVYRWDLRLDWSGGH
jgi:hypothetical protein